jgi:hypothetical protein
MDRYGAFAAGQLSTAQAPVQGYRRVKALQTHSSESIRPVFGMKCVSGETKSSGRQVFPLPLAGLRSPTIAPLARFR